MQYGLLAKRKGSVRGSAARRIEPAARSEFEG
jgi:hypothetical protein